MPNVSNNESNNYQFTHGFFVLISILLFIILFGIAKRAKSSVSSKNEETGRHFNHDFKCIVPNSYFPEITSIVSKNEMIMDELVNIIKSGIDNWPKLDNDSDPKGCLSSDINYKHFALILNKEAISENILKCPNTYDLIKNVPGLINAVFLCLEPLTHISQNKSNIDNIDSNYRVHIPLIPPENSNIHNDEVMMDIYNNENQEKTRLNWLNLKTGFFVYNTLCYNQLFNNTDRHMITLALDIKRNDL